jgi:hypothetical protein
VPATRSALTSQARARTTTASVSVLPRLPRTGPWGGTPAGARRERRLATAERVPLPALRSR